MSSSLARFHAAQADAHHGYAAALAEIRTTGKQSHWIWYVFPQLAGLGRSPQALHYALAGRAEAEQYLEDPLLLAHLLEITSAVAGQLDRGWSLSKIMGSSLDALKLVSSLTLFQTIGDESPSATAGDRAELSAVIGRVLRAAAEQGYERCAFTARQLAE